MPIEVPEKLSAMRFDLNFMKESRYNDKLSLKSEQNEQTYLFAYVNEAGEALCRMALEVR